MVPVGCLLTRACNSSATARRRVRRQKSTTVSPVWSLTAPRPDHLYGCPGVGSLTCWPLGLHRARRVGSQLMLNSSASRVSAIVFVLAPIPGPDCCSTVGGR
jgi:hypothetical protein